MEKMYPSRPLEILISGKNKGKPLKVIKLKIKLFLEENCCNN